MNKSKVVTSDSKWRLKIVRRLFRVIVKSERPIPRIL